jgi:hypothetical protein
MLMSKLLILTEYFKKIDIKNVSQISNRDILGYLMFMFNV